MLDPASSQGPQPGVRAPGSSGGKPQGAAWGSQSVFLSTSAPGRPRDSGRPPPQIPDHELLRNIGHGAYGDVWLARSALGTYRAVKIVYRSAFDHDRPYEREFEGIRNFEPISRSHGSQVDILHVGRGEGYFYYVMELADDANVERATQNSEGGDEVSTPKTPAVVLAPSTYVPRTLKHDLTQRGRLPPGECLKIGLALTTALGHLHQHKLVHRDVKPSNIIFIDGVPKLADIGLVTETDRTLSFVGTEGYIAPEGPGTPEADLYSLGKVLYELSTGKDRHEYPALPPDLRLLEESRELVELNAVIVKACAREPKERYLSAEAMHADLAFLEKGKSVQRRRLAERRWAAALRATLATAMIATLASLVWLAVNGLRPRNVAVTASPVATAPNSIFVLPFRNIGTNGVDDDLRGRITDAFIDALPLIPGVQTGPRKSGWVNLDEDELRHSLRKTNAMRYILTGRIAGSGDGLRLTLRLFAMHSDQPLWTESFSGKTNEVVALERRALAATVSTLGVKIATNDQRGIDQLLGNNLKALAWYRQAREVYTRKGGTLIGFNDVMSLAQKARTLDPGYLDAVYFDVYMTRNLFQDRAPAEIWPRVHDGVDAILSRDDTHYGALDQESAYQWIYQGHWAKADALMERLYQSVPEQLEHMYRAWWFRMRGRMNEARLEQEKAEHPEPMDLDQRYLMVTSRWATRYYDEAVQIALRTQELGIDAADASALLAHCLIAKGDYVRGIAAIEKAQEFWSKQEFVALLGYAYARMSQLDKAQQVLADLLQIEGRGHYLQPYFVARVYAALGQNQKALDWLERAEEVRSEYLFIPDWGCLRTDIAWDGLQEEPRYWELCKRLGLGKDQWPR